MLKIVVGLIAALCIALATVPMGYAIEPPDTLAVNSVSCYEGTLENDDILCVARYTIGYDTAPTSTVSQAFVGRFLSGTTEIASVAPVTVSQSLVSVSTSPPFLGYGQGVMSWYWNAFQVNQLSIVFGGTGYGVRLQGNPSLFITPPAVSFTSIDWRSPPNPSVTLAQEIITLAGQLQTNWAGNDISMTETIGDHTVLTSPANNYFAQAIPNLCFHAPDACLSSIRAASFREDEGGISLANSFEDFWVGTPFENSIGSWNILYRTVAWFGLMMVAGFFVQGITKKTDITFLGTFGVVLPLGMLIGMVPMALVFIMAFGAALLMGYKYFFDR